MCSTRKTTKTPPGDPPPFILFQPLGGLRHSFSRETRESKIAQPLLYRRPRPSLSCAQCGMNPNPLIERDSQITVRAFRSTSKKKKRVSIESVERRRENEQHSFLYPGPTGSFLLVYFTLLVELCCRCWLHLLSSSSLTARSRRRRTFQMFQAVSDVTEL